MTGTAMLIFACGFFIYAVSPSYANEISEVNKPQMKSYDDYFAVVSNGYLYTWSSKQYMTFWCNNQKNEYANDFAPKKRKLP